MAIYSNQVSEAKRIKGQEYPDVIDKQYTSSSSNDDASRKTKFPKEISTNVIDIKSGKVIEVKSTNREDLEKQAGKICTDMSTQIKYFNDAQQKSINGIQKSIAELEKKENINNKQAISSKKLESVLLNSFGFSLLEFTGVLHEFDANGEEDQDTDNNDEYNLVEPEDNDSDIQDDDSEGTADVPNNAESDENANDDEYSLNYDNQDGEENTEDQDNNEPSTQSEEPADSEDGDTESDDDTDNNDDEYTLDDDNNSSGDDNEEEQQSDDSQTTDEPDEDTGDEYSLDDNNQDNDGGESGDDNSDLGAEDGEGEEQDKLDSIKQIEKDLFENLSPQQKNIKIKTLKKNYMTLHARCNAILDMINDYTPSGEATVRIFDYIQKTVQEVQDNMHDYLTQTFDTKSFIDNQAQFKQYLAILNSVKNILNEFISEPDSNKQS